MTSSTTAAHILRHLKQLGDPEDARFLQGFFKTGPGQYGEGDVFLGVRVPVTRKLARQYRDTSLAQVTKLLTSKYHEARLLALLTMVYQFRNGDSGTQKRTYDVYRSHLRWINNWDLIDGSAGYIVGGYLVNRSRTPLVRLARSPNLWRRRVAIMATLHFIQQGDFDDTLKLADMLLHDEHDLIHKAVGWMLREVGNRDRAIEVAFLDSRYPTMPRTMLRYAIEKFPERLRQGYLKGTR
jgi:3-methyladenine DNA glycosylase AlkD